MEILNYGVRANCGPPPPTPLGKMFKSKKFLRMFKFKKKSTWQVLDWSQQWVNSGDQAQIKKFMELASYNQNYFCLSFKGKKIIKYVKMTGVLANDCRPRPIIERNYFFFSKIYFVCVIFN